MDFAKLLFLLLSFDVALATDLAPLKTKQDIRNIRFISRDGRFTYYQRGSGDLIFTLNYKTKKIFDLDKGTHYLIKSTPARKNVSIQVIKDYFTTHNLRANQSIYVSPFGSSKVTLVGEGKDPRLHLGDNWISYFDHYRDIIYFKSLFPPEKNYKIKLNNKKNLFFSPQVVMINDKEVLYTDLSKQGLPSIVYFNLRNKKFTPLAKIKSKSAKIELCRIGESLVIGKFGIGDSTYKSFIESISFADFIAGKPPQTIYESKLNDIGHINCTFDSKMLYFIKNVSASKRPIAPQFDVASLDLKSKKVILLTQKKEITQLIEMDGKLIVSHLGDYYLLKGSDPFEGDKFGEAN